MRRRSVSSGVLGALLALGCHHDVEMVPLAESTIYVTDRFFDVQALSKDRAVVVGYGGKILDTADGGRNWTVRSTGTEHALFSVDFPDTEHGWVVGQDGLVLATSDGGKTWARQESNAEFTEADGTKKRAYLFAVDALDAQRAYAVGDRSMLAMTTDGGRTWTARKVPMELDLTGGEQLAAADPVFYDIQMVSAQEGWIVGEFGKIMHTTDGGATWKEQEKPLMGDTYFDLLDLPTLFGVHVRNAQELTAVGLEAHVARTTDGGKDWQFETVDAGDVPLIDPLFEVTEDPQGNGWAVGAGGQVIKRPAGGTWQRAELGQDMSTWLRAVSFSDPQNGWMVGGRGRIFRTTDGGKLWLASLG